MQVAKGGLLELLEGKIQYRIPVFQRQYEWTNVQAKRLLDDIIAAAKKRDSQTHFTGYITYRPGVDHSFEVRRRFLTDGQQRITTTVLLIRAIAQVLDEKFAGALLFASGSSLTSKKLLEDYVFNSNEEGPARYKLVLKGKNQPDFQSIIDNPALCSGTSTQLRENFNYFLSRLRDMGNLEAVVLGLRRLQVTSSVLDDTDNPQEIYDSLNSTGLPLSQSARIRNYLLMGLDENVMDKAYVDFWAPMEEFFSGDNSAVFDKFIKDYLTSKTEQIAKIADIYNQFKEFVASQSDMSNVEISADLARYATLYSHIALGTEPDKPLRETFARHNDIKFEAARPFLLSTYDDFQKNLVSVEGFRAVAELMESYAFRRTVCGLPSNRRAKLLTRIIGKVEGDDYVQSVEDELASMTGLDRFPSDQEFKEALLKKDCYNLKGARYMLTRLETHGAKEPLSAAGLSIEHIMPQGEALNDEWQRALGPDWGAEHAKAKHLLGNLTLTGYNSEMSDMSFQDKRNKPGSGYRNSGLRLNAYLRECESWTPLEIAKRGELLADKALLVWPGLAGADQEQEQEPKQNKLCVRFPDRTVVHESTSTKTLVAVLKRIGLDTVATLGERLNGQDLVGTERGNPIYVPRQVGKWLVAVGSNTQAKVEVLQRVSAKLNLSLEVSIGSLPAANGIPAPSPAPQAASYAPRMQMPSDLSELANVVLVEPQKHAA